VGKIVLLFYVFLGWFGIPRRTKWIKPDAIVVINYAKARVAYSRRNWQSPVPYFFNRIIRRINRGLQK
jgi:hypothetical protein